MFGHVGVQPVGSLADTANLLAEALGGLSFAEDRDRRYDEYPAYTAVRDGLRYALLGLPASEEDIRDDPSDDFELLVEPVSVHPGLPKSDISTDLIARIGSHGRLVCWALT